MTPIRRLTSLLGDAYVVGGFQPPWAIGIENGKRDILQEAERTVQS